MEYALREAKNAFEEGETPIGAVIVCNGRILGKGHNRVEALNDPTAHAEIIAIGAASSLLKNWRLDNCTLYVTLEPCLMCTGAILNARIKEVVFALEDPRMGALVSNKVPEYFYKIGQFPIVRKGPLEDKSRELLQKFFRRIRRNGK